tara:strand:- start:86 stop:295 length:210 start_codon:yes stop_codon:yes gene_type:complete
MNKEITTREFIIELTKILGDDFFLNDMIWQEELFEKQEKLSKLICKGANSGLLVAKLMVKNLPNTFYTE